MAENDDLSALFAAAEAAVEKHERRPEGAEEEPSQEALFEEAVTKSLHKARDDLETALSAEQEKVDTLREEKERVAARAADRLERYKAHSTRDRAEAERGGGEALLKALAPVLDDLERALQVDTSSYSQDQLDAVRPITEGLTLVARRLEQALAAQEAECISSMGKPFDPAVAEAVHRLEDPSVPPNTVLEEYHRAWRFRGRLVRPGAVVVSFGGSKSEPPASNPEPEPEVSKPESEGSKPEPD